MVAEEDLLLKSYSLIESLFADKVDKLGVPYIEHLKFVCNSFEDSEYKIVGLLHDILEDTDLTCDDLKKLGYPDYIIEAINIVTKKDGEEYDDFINRILASNNLIAIRVKERDMFHNMNEKRLNGLSSSERERLKNKYKNQYIKITNYLKGRTI